MASEKQVFFFGVPAFRRRKVCGSASNFGATDVIVGRLNHMSADSQAFAASVKWRRGKSGLHRTQWWVTPTVREDRASATESKPPERDYFLSVLRSETGNSFRGKGETVR